MESMAEMAAAAAAAGAMPRLADGTTSMQELLRQLAESVATGIMSAEADEPCASSGNSRNGYRERRLLACAGTLTPRIPKLRRGSFFPEDATGLCQRAGRALVAAAGMQSTGTSTRKAQRIAEKLGVDRLPEDQASSIAQSLDADVEELLGRPPGTRRCPASGSLLPM